MLAPCFQLVTPNNYTVKPALATTSIMKPPLLRDHIFISPGLTFLFKWPSIKGPPVLRDHILVFSWEVSLYRYDLFNSPYQSGHLNGCDYKRVYSTYLLTAFYKVVARCAGNAILDKQAKQNKEDTLMLLSHENNRDNLDGLQPKCIYSNQRFTKPDQLFQRNGYDRDSWIEKTKRYRSDNLYTKSKKNYGLR